MKQPHIARRAPAPKPNRSEFVQRAGRGGRPTGGAASGRATLPTPISKAIKSA